ncbi:MAG: hypothetical protein HY883_03185 [Deltaproteobacteria bacterium]|nr:hypothetical protein [Deltaproteobacteria bacterium]
MEHILLLIAILTLAALVINLPFGYLRSGTKKFSLKWFLYIHVPVPILIVLRLLAGVGYRAIPVVVAGAVIGQFIGGLIGQGRVPPDMSAT